MLTYARSEYYQTARTALQNALKAKWSGDALYQKNDTAQDILKRTWHSAYAWKVAEALKKLGTPIPADINGRRDAIIARRDGWVTLYELSDSPGRLWTYEQWDYAVDQWFEAVKKITEDEQFAGFYLDKGAISVLMPTPEPGRYRSFQEIAGALPSGWMNTLAGRAAHLPRAGMCGLSVRVGKGTKHDYIALQFFPLVDSGTDFRVAVPDTGVAVSADTPHVWRLLERWNAGYDMKRVIADRPFEYIFPASDLDSFLQIGTRYDERGMWLRHATVEAFRRAGYGIQRDGKILKGPRVITDFGYMVRTP